MNEQIKEYCNKCGKVLNEWDIQNRFMIETVIGYGSKYDLNKIKLRLCCNCLDELVDNCIISPISD